jgi:hypothetical protein
MKIYILTLTLVTSLLTYLPAQDYHLSLHGGKEIPEEGMRSHISMNEMVNGFYYSILQFYDVPDEHVREQLSDAGIELLEYVPNYAWISRIKGGADMSDIPIRAVIPLRPTDKIFPSLQNGDFPECLLESGKVKVKALLYPRVSQDASREMLEQAGFEELSLEGVSFNLAVEVSELETLAGLPLVMAIVPQECLPEEEGIRGRTLVRANGLTSGSQYTGLGVPIAIGDDGHVSHEDFRGRLFDFTTGDSGQHGDMTMGLAGGCGNIDPKGIGMATGSDLYSFDIMGYPHHINAIENYINYEIEITSTSYGEGCGAYYTYTANRLDEQVYENNNFLHCFSAGNKGYDGCNPIYGPFANANATRFGNLTGGRKVGKNAIAVGNVHYTDSLRITSSRGPTNDGRIKPDICAPGQGNMTTSNNNTYQEGGGTSAASPVIAGTAALIYEAYQEQEEGNSPPSGLVKAMILCSAEDLGRKGPDYEYGWGRVNYSRALEVLQEDQYVVETIEHGYQNYHQIVIPEGVGQARVMVYWMDPAGSVLSSKALVNDIDISLQNSVGQTYLPHVLSHYPNYDSLTTPAYRGHDHVNNMEEVILDNPNQGSYTLSVKGHMIPEGPQEYFVVYSFIKDEIKVTYPYSGEGFVPGDQEVLRWDAHGDDGIFLLEYSPDGMNNWQTIVSDVSGHYRYYLWTVPNTVSGNAYVRVSRGDQEGHSHGNFTIMDAPTFDFNYVDENTGAISWYPVPGATSYEVYAIGEKFMEIIGTTTGTTFNFPTQLWESNWYSIRPVINENAKGARAVAKEYIHQTCNANFGINFQFDLYPGEISWQVASNETGDVVATGGPYDYLPPNSYVEVDKCLPYGCYTLRIDDSYGDGICCNNGDGYYEFIDQFGDVLTTGGDFGGVKFINFCLDNNDGDMAMSVASVSQVTCNGESDGEAIVSATGGSGNYYYLWSNGATVPHVQGLSAGAYQVTVTDGFTQLSNIIIITEPTPIDIDAIPVDINCSAITAGSVLTEVSGGLPPYNYFWSTGASTPDIVNIEAGTYNVTVVDAKGCMVSSGTTVTQAEDLILTTMVISPSCFGAANGVALASTIGGTGNYSYTWSTGDNTASVFGLTAGDYQVSVSDSNGCDGVKFVTVDEPELLQVENIVAQPGCEEGASGSIELVTFGGTPPYNYSWNTGQTSYIVYDLTSGGYSVSVSDMNNCMETVNVELNISSPMVLNFESSNASESENGSVDLTVSNGLPPYTYYWSNTATTEDLSNLSSGSYSVTVTDDSGCEVTGNVDIGGDEYCNLRGSNTNYEWIDRISWAGEEFVTGPDGGLGIYHNVTFAAVVGETYAFEAEPDFMANEFSEYWSIWIDFNGDFDFSDPGEEIFSDGPHVGAIWTAIEIPADATLGITTMRIAMKYGSLPPLCGVYGYGEVEEYSILIQSESSGLGAIIQDGPRDGFQPQAEKEIQVNPIFGIYPNPATDYIRIPFKGMTLGEEVKCKVYSSEGRIVEQLTHKMSESGPHWQISVRKLPEGLYRLELFSDNSVYIGNFAVHK